MPPSAPGTKVGQKPLGLEGVTELIGLVIEVAVPAFVVIAVDAQGIQAGGPVELVVASVQADFGRFLIDVAAVEELEPGLRRASESSA